MDQDNFNTAAILGVIAASLFVIMFWTMIFPILYHIELNMLMTFFLCIISIIVIGIIAIYIADANKSP